MKRMAKRELLKKNKKMFNELSSSNHLVADIIENMHEGFFVIDGNWQFTYINRAGEMTFGKSRDELLGKKLTEVLRINDTALLRYHEVMNEKRSVDFEIISESFGNKWFEIRAYPTKNGLTGYFKDISSRKMAEQEFYRLDRLNLIKELAFQSDEKANRAAELVIANKELAFQNEEKGKRAAELIIANDELIFQSEEKGRRAAELIIANKELVFQSKEKCKRAAELIIANKELVFQSKEKCKRAAELIIANKELVFQSKEKGKRAAEFTTERQHRLFEEKMARLDRLNLVGQMAAGIGHEIRNPMTTVRGYLQLLGAKPEYAVRKSTFDLMISELDRANAIITEFLSLAQTKRTEQRAQDLNDLLSNLYPLIEADTFTQNKQIYFVPGEIPNLELNGNEITQLVLNLTRNGLEAMDERGCLNISSYVEEANVVLAISDEGCGIPPENLRKLGTPFFTTKDSGTGLGLATCYKIAESHNAKIDIDSSSRGTTFFINFPIPESSSKIVNRLATLG